MLILNKTKVIAVDYSSNSTYIMQYVYYAYIIPNYMVNNVV